MRWRDRIRVDDDLSVSTTPVARSTRTTASGVVAEAATRTACVAVAASHSRGSRPSASGGREHPSRCRAARDATAPRSCTTTTMRWSSSERPRRGAEHPLRPAELRAGGACASTRHGLRADTDSTIRPIADEIQLPVRRPPGLVDRFARSAGDASRSCSVPSSPDQPPTARCHPTASADGATTATPAASRPG